MSVATTPPCVSVYACVRADCTYERAIREWRYWPCSRYHIPITQLDAKHSTAQRALQKIAADTITATATATTVTSHSSSNSNSHSDSHSHTHPPFSLFCFVHTTKISEARGVIRPRQGVCDNSHHLGSKRLERRGNGVQRPRTQHIYLFSIVPERPPPPLRSLPL